MKTNVLTRKQHRQLIKFAVMTRSHSMPDKLPILELLDECICYCTQIRFSSCNYSESFTKRLTLFVGRYYPYGYRLNTGYYDSKQFNYLYKLKTIRFVFSKSVFPPCEHTSEKMLVVRTLRACYKYIISEHTEEAKSLLIQKLETIRNMSIDYKQ